MKKGLFRGWSDCWGIVGILEFLSFVSDSRTEGMIQGYL